MGEKIAMDTNQLNQFLEDANFSDIEQIDDFVFRGVKKSHLSPYAVYYLDLNSSLPNTEEHLSKYQDQIIGPHYFKENKNLQWNNYLYFIRRSSLFNNDEFKKTRKLIEQDRNYARKYVVSDSDLSDILKPVILSTADTEPHANILSVWTENLEKNGLYEIVTNDCNLPQRINLIENLDLQERRITSYIPSPKKIDDLPFIDTLTLESYRQYPIKRQFNFGKVNLIEGNNGSGKTSLLEAIELFYCGRTKRNKDSSEHYKILVGLLGGGSVNATHRREKKVFRERNLLWYGQPETKTNNLYLSFSQFNFLDTDAAVNLSNGTADIKENLSKLLVGSDASRIWKNIERVLEASKLELRNLRQQEKQFKAEIDELNKRISHVDDISRESDIIYSRLIEILRAREWNVNNDLGKSQLASDTIKQLSELIPILNEIGTLEWIESPRTKMKLDNFIHENSEKLESAKKSYRILQNKTKEQERNKKSLKNCEQAINILKEMEIIVDSGIIDKESSLQKHKENIANKSSILLGVDGQKYDDVIPNEKHSEIFLSYINNVKSDLLKSRKMLSDNEGKYKEFSIAYDQSKLLSQQLRQIAEKILQGQEKFDECPLCHAEYDEGQLSERMKYGLDESMERTAQAMLSMINNNKKSIDDLNILVSMLEALNGFKNRAELLDSVTVKSVLKSVEQHVRSLNESRAYLETLNQEKNALEVRGVSLSRLEEISDELEKIGHPIKDFKKESLSRLMSLLKGNCTSFSSQIEKNVDEIKRLQEAVLKQLGFTSNDLDVISSELSDIEYKIENTSRLIARLNQAKFSLLVNDKEKSFSDILVDAESIKSVSSSLQNAIQKEQQTDTDKSEAIRRKAVVNPKLESLQVKLSNFEHASKALRNLVKYHSLESAMKNAMEESRTTIQSIFSRIHSPAEFGEIGNDWEHLIRKTGDSAKLSEISTGQRAAFALSIFLSQNARLDKAPPVILVDDPIAHIDDLNALSFLDYLRELALTEKRQIFFATANSKIASLFKRKFDFLGDDFKHISLARS